MTPKGGNRRPTTYGPLNPQQRRHPSHGSRTPPPAPAQHGHTTARPHSRYSSPDQIDIFKARHPKGIWAPVRSGERADGAGLLTDLLATGVARSGSAVGGRVLGSSDGLCAD